MTGTGLLIAVLGGQWAAPGMAVACTVAAIAEQGAGMLLDKDQIFAADDIKTERVAIPEWGGEVAVRGLTGAQRDAWEASMTIQRGRNTTMDMRNFRARLVVKCVIDETGALVFNDGDVEQLSGKSGAALDRIYDVAARLSGISKEDVDELTKDFGTAAGNGSSST